MKAWKRVDLADAEAVARGSMIIGTLADYASLEQGRPVAVATPTWTYCMSAVGCRYDPTPDTPKAIFEISDIALLGQFAMARIGKQVFSSVWNAVTYAPGADGVADPFVKDVAFQDEQEFRFVLQPNPGVSVDAPLIIKADYTVASLLTRIA